MRTVYDPVLRAHLTYDNTNRLRHIAHEAPEEVAAAPEVPEAAAAETDPVTARDVAAAYVERIAPLLRVPAAQLEAVGEFATNVAPQERPVRYRVSREKTLFDATTVGFAQTVHDVPVWDSGISVVVKHGPYRVISADDNTIDEEPALAMPPNEVIGEYQRLFAVAEAETKVHLTRRKFEEHVSGTAFMETSGETSSFIRSILHTDDVVRMIRGRFFVYRFNPTERFPILDSQEPGRADEAPPPPVPFMLPPVPEEIVPGAFYVVAEITFDHQHLVWQMLVELQSRAVLLLRPQAASVNGMVFRVDPLTATGNAANTPDRANTILNPLRASVPLPNLAAAANGSQLLRGTRALLRDVHNPNIAAPTRPTGQDFDYEVRTNEFAAVNAYYHVEQFFRTIESLGFSLHDYFNGTTFPVDVDHRAGIQTGHGIEVNAHCVSNGLGGIGHVCFALGDLTDTANPLGRACDSRVFWHELGGHGVLYEWVNHANFKFAHSAGDSLSAIFHAPDSRAPDPRRYAPWSASNLRRNDRDVTAGWAWGGLNDDKGYQSEEILATTLYRMYLSVGGASPDALRRRFASRLMLYLILRAISTLTPATNPDHPEKFAAALVTADRGDWKNEGLFGGAYGKVIRWAFEKQGAYQPVGGPVPVTRAGSPPDVDVYIDDGQRGEYDFLPDHASAPGVWNRHVADNGTAHQEPRLGVTNHAYVRIRNRGPQTAAGVNVRAFHSHAGAALRWPIDFQPMTTGSITVGTVLGNDTQDRIVGPFSWTPVMNASGGDAMLMIVTATQDPSNADRFTATRTIEDWRLVTSDNNIGQRNVRPV